MNARIILPLLATSVGLIYGCSSGLGKNLPNQNPPPPPPASNNLPLGLDLGFVPASPLAELSAAGVVVPAFGNQVARDVVLLAFTTASPADSGSGTTTLSRDATTDGNGADDVFVAAICAQDVETRAFSQSLAGKFRHPRCMTCHSMQAADSTAFVSAEAIGQPHALGMPTGPTFPNNDPVTCAPCHVTSTSFPVVGWQAPAVSFDIRPKTVAQIAMMAMNVPADETEHFVNDRRVNWALNSGLLPQVGGRNGIADDNQNGIDEPEDTDGVIRTVPGGSVGFLRDIDAWRASGMVETTKDAVKDITLVSRAVGTTSAGNAASSAPRVLWVANPGFNPPGNNLVGTLYVAYQSMASDLVAADANGVQDVFRTAVELRAEEDPNGNPAPGSLNLRTLDTTQLCSAINGGATAGDAAAAHPVIGGANAQFVAFESLATNLVSGFTDANGPAAADVYVRLLNSSETLLVSHTVGNAAIGGSGASEAPAIDATGTAVAFESDATDLIADDQNGLRDIFHARIDSGSPFTKVRSSVTDTGQEGIGGASRAASIQVGNAGRIRVAFESDQTNLAPSLGAPTNVYAYDSMTGFTTLLNQRLSPTGNAIGNGSARAPVLSANGMTVAFESDARNLDVLRPDGNRFTDVFLVELAQVDAGRVLPFRISLTAKESADGNGPSTKPTFGNFATASPYPVGFAAYQTTGASNLIQSNLGTSDSTNVIVSFLQETSGVFADFTGAPVGGPAATLVRGPAPLQVQFTDLSTGSPTSWAWDFDNDGNVDSTERSPTFTYATPGTYSVTLLARNANSEGTKTATDLVLVVDTVVADFSTSVTSGTAPLPVTFADLSTQSPTSWAWDFDNDGNIDSTDQNPPTQVYSTPGTYSVRLVATNELGSTEVLKSNLVQVFAPVVANFSRSPSSGIAPFAVQFTDLTTGSPTSWAWDFDQDGLIDSTDQNPLFTYTVAGTFDVTLTATGPGGTNAFTFANCVTVAGAVSAGFTITVTGTPVTSGYTGTTIQFTSTSTGSISSYAWDFDNVPGTTESTLQNPTRSFSNTSVTVFTVRLTVSGPGGTAFVTHAFTSVPASETLSPLVATQDNTIYSGGTGNNNGGGVNLVIGKTYTAGYRRSMLQFDIGSVPMGSTILSAAVQLTDTSPSGTATGGAHLGGSQLAGTQTYEFHRLTNSWTEGTGAGAAGMGSATTGGGATFDERFAGTTWSSAGGDFSGTTSGTIQITDPAASPWPTFTSTSLVSDVQAWVDGTNSNFGWLLKSGTETGLATVATIKWIASRDNATAGNRPQLLLTFRRPLP